MKAYIAGKLNGNSKLLKHSIIILAGSAIVNALNYLYQLIMGRLLGPVEYGVLGALFALITIVTFSFGTIRTVSMKFASGFSAKKEYGKIHTLLTGVLSRLSILGAVGLVVFVVLTPYISRFLHIQDYRLVWLSGIFMFISLLTPVPNGILNGLQRYLPMMSVSVAVALLKLLAGAGLVFLGWGVFGALVGINIAQLLGLVLFFAFLVGYLRFKKKPLDKVSLFSYSVPVFVAITAINLFVNLDVILAKHFFTGVVAGHYVAASVLAKIILFASSALLMAMFPKVSELNEKGEDTSPLLKSTMFYTLVISGTAVLLYYFVPTFLVNMLFGPEYPVAPVIPVFGVAIAIFSISNVLVNYNLAVGKTGFAYFLLPFLLLEVFGVVMFHSSILEVVQVLLVTNVLTAAFLVVYTREAVL